MIMIVLELITAIMLTIMKTKVIRRNISCANVVSFQLFQDFGATGSNPEKNETCTF